jgi:formate hydrogenlyase transcriptional activator
MASAGQQSEPLNIELLVDSIPALIHTARPDGYLDYFNKPWLEYLGVTLDKVAGWNWTDFIHPEDLDGIVAKWRASLATGEIFEYETRVRRANGKYRWMLHRKVPLRDADGNIVKWYGSSLDIEERKQAAEKLRRSERDLHSIIETIPTMVWSAAPDGSVDFFNPRWLNYTGLSPDQSRDWRWTAAIHPDDLSQLTDAWQSILVSGEPGETESRLRRVDGAYRWFLFRANALRDESGKIVKWYGTNVDIEDRKRAEEELRRSEFYLSEGQRLAHMGSWAFDPDGFYYWSPELFRMHGLDAANRPPSVEEYLDRVHPHDRESMADLIKGILTKASTFDATKRIVRPNGEVRYIRCVGAPVVENQSLKKYVGSALDVTEHEVLTQELRRREAYLAEAQRLSHTGSFGWKPSTGEIVWSDETYRIFEYEHSVKSTIDSVVQRVHPQDRDDFQKVIDGASRGAADFEHTYRLLLPNGRVKHVHAIARVLQDASGNREFVGAVTDMTERKTAEEALRRSEAYLAEAQRLSQTGSWAWSPEQDIRYWSDECYRVLSFDPQDGLPRFEQFFQRIHPDDQPGFRELIQTAISEKAEWQTDYRIVHPRGAIRDIHAVGHPVLSTSGHLVEFVGTVIDITERKRAEEDLRTSERKYRHLVDTTPAFIHTALPDGSLDFLSRGWLEYGGVPQTDFLDWRWTAAIHPEDVEGFVDKWRAALASGEPFVAESRVRRADGEYRWFLQRNVPLRDETGTIVKWYGTGIDIEDRKQAEEALRSSEAYLAEGQRLAHMSSWVWQAAGGDALHLSGEWYRIYGFDPGLGVPQWEERLRRVHPEDRGWWQGTIERAIQERSEYNVEFRILLPDGTIKWVQTVGHPVLSATGELVQFVGSSMDVTERKAAEERIRGQEAELRQMLDFTPQLVVVFGSNRERLYANRVLLDYLGLTLEEWRQTFDRSEFIHPDDWERVNGHFERALSSGTSFESELRLRKSDGSCRWFLARCNPVRDDKGQITRWYNALTDIEDRKRAEERLQQENVALREEVDKASMFEEIVGTSPALQTVLSRISKVAPSNSTVLITGETGTGKELVARAIHRRSDRSSRAFVSVNCAAIPRELIASELFGHEKGAFTGAIQQRLGRFELANGGTLFLDEVGELPPETQIALLRVLQEHEFERVGGSRPIRADVRVIAATNRDLQTAISAGSFRSDLFYRLHVFPIEMPALRERKGDIRLLVEYFIDRYARKAGKRITTVDTKTLRLLESYAWPGNIRELQNVIERSVIVCETANFSVDESWLSQKLPEKNAESQLYLSDKVAAQEKEIIEAALQECRGQVSGPSGAAAKLGIARSTLESKIRSLQINKNRFKA